MGCATTLRAIAFDRTGRLDAIYPRPVNDLWPQRGYMKLVPQNPPRPDCRFLTMCRAILRAVRMDDVIQTFHCPKDTAQRGRMFRPSVSQ